MAPLYGEADLVLRVGRPSDEEIEMLRPEVVLIGTLGTLVQPEARPAAGGAGDHGHQHGRHPAHHPRPVHGLALEPEHGRWLQGGPHGRDRLPKFFPLLTTAAGTVRPARGLIMGAGVAGLMAIGTARRLGAVVEAFDVRPVVKEQVESLGATFVEVPMTDEEKASAETSGGYAPR